MDIDQSNQCVGGEQILNITGQQQMKRVTRGQGKLCNNLKTREDELPEQPSVSGVQDHRYSLRRKRQRSLSREKQKQKDKLEPERQNEQMSIVRKVGKKRKLESFKRKSNITRKETLEKKQELQGSGKCQGQQSFADKKQIHNPIEGQSQQCGQVKHRKRRHRWRCRKSSRFSPKKNEIKQDQVEQGKQTAVEVHSETICIDGQGESIHEVIEISTGESNEPGIAIVSQMQQSLKGEFSQQSSDKVELSMDKGQEDHMFNEKKDQQGSIEENLTENKNQVLQGTGCIDYVNKHKNTYVEMKHEKVISDTEQGKQKNIHYQHKEDGDGKVLSSVKSDEHSGIQSLESKLIQEGIGVKQMQQSIEDEQVSEGFREGPNNCKGRRQEDGEIEAANSLESLDKIQEMSDIKKCQLKQSDSKEDLQKSTGEQDNQLNMNSSKSVEKGSIRLGEQSSEMNEFSKSQNTEAKKQAQNIGQKNIQEATVDFERMEQEACIDLQETSDQFDQQTADKDGQQHFMECQDLRSFLNQRKSVSGKQGQQSYLEEQSTDSDETAMKRDWKKLERPSGAIKKGMQSDLTNQKNGNCETSEQIPDFQRPVADISLRSISIEEPVAHCSKTSTCSQPSYDFTNRAGSFQTVVILSPHYYQGVLKRFETPQVKLLYTNSFGSNSIGYLLNRHKSELKKPILWLSIPGIYNVVNCKPYPLCKSCTKPVNVMNLRFSQMHKAINASASSCITHKKWLKKGSIITSVPPVPTAVLMIENYITHDQLHMAANESNLPVTARKYYSKIQTFYAEFCRKWTERACNEAKSWLKENPFEVLLRGDHMDCVNICYNNPECFTSLHNWCDLMQNFIDSALQLKPAPKENVVPMYFKCGKLHPASDATEVDSFEKVVVVGNIDSTKTLQFMTRNFNVEYLNENVDIIKNGVEFFEKKLNTYSGKILWVVVCEVNLLAEKSPNGSAQCANRKCSNRIPAIINKNNKNGSIAYRGLSNKKLVDYISNKVFNFGVLLTTHYLPENSAIFFTPILPVRAVWNCDYRLRHIDLHNFYERHPDLLHLAGSIKPWKNCVDALDEAWLKKIAYYFYNDSDVIHLLNLYKREKTPVLNLVTRFSDVTAVERTWSVFMVHIFRHYLGISGNSVITDLHCEPALAVNCTSEKDQMVELASRQIKKENEEASFLKVTVKLEPIEEHVTEMEFGENCAIKMECGKQHGIRMESVEQHVIKSEPQSYLVSKPNNQPSVIQDDTRISSDQQFMIPSKTSSVVVPGIAQSSSKFQASDDRKKSACKLESEYKRAKRELLRDCQSELEMYIMTPEIHPEYEDKYAIFKNLYSVKFPQKQNERLFNSQWKLFWKREVKELLLKECKMKLQALNLEHSYKLEKEAEDLLKTKPSEKQSEEERSDKDEAQHLDKKENELPVDNKLFLEEALRLLSEVCPHLCELSSPVNSLCEKIIQCDCNHEMISKIFEIGENESLVKEVSKMTKELAEITKDSGSEKQVLKFQLVSVQSLKLLQWAKTCKKQEHCGLDIQNIARLTYMKDPAYIIQTIKDLFSFKDINVSKDEINDVYKLVLSAHEDMSYKDFGHISPTVSDTEHKKT